MPRRGKKVELDRERRVRYPLAAVEEIQERYDVDIVAGESFRFAEIDDITWAVWLGLKYAGEKPDVDGFPWWKRALIRVGLMEHPVLTQDHVAQWIDMQNLVEVSGALNEAMGGESIDPADLEAAAADPTTARPEEEKTPSR